MSERTAFTFPEIAMLFCWERDRADQAEETIKFQENYIEELREKIVELKCLGWSTVPREKKVEEVK